MHQVQSTPRAVHLPNLQAIRTPTSTPGSALTARALGSLTSKIDGAFIAPGPPSDAQSSRKFEQTPRNGKQQQVEHVAKEKYGRTLAHVDAIDVRRNPDLHCELAAFALNEHFDNRGAPRYRRLGLAFVAQQNPGIQSTFGSTAENASDAIVGRRTSAKAYLASVAALDKDAEYARKHRAELMRHVDEKQRSLNEDVQQRQLELLFTEVPHFAQHLPAMAKRTRSLGDLLVPDVDLHEERKNRHRADQQNNHFDDKYWMEGKKMNWLFNHEEALNLSKISDLWTRATRGKQCPMGMDRTTFCRFIIDVGLVDQSKVHYFWAISLFDEIAQPMRVCAPNAIAPESAPIARVVSRWSLLSILDALLRQHFTEKNKGYFLGSLLQIARFRLPAHIVEESDLLTDESQDVPGGGAQNEAPVVEILESRAGIAEAAYSKNGALVKRSSKIPTMSKSQMEREGQMRDTLVHSMLLEPEVLHAISQYYKLFENMFLQYADEPDNMNFRMLLQFCVDFQLTPTIVPAHSLRRLYISAACTESLISTLVLRGDPGEGQPPDSMGRIPGQAQNQRPPSAYSSSTQGRPGTPSQAAQQGVDGQSNTDKITLPWLQIWDAARRNSPKGDRKHRGGLAKFGVNAFIETLCRGSFTYLESYGNAQQRCAGGYARITWLLTYLHNNFMHLQQSLKRRLQANKPMEVHAPLRKLLESLDSETWNQCAYVDVPFLSPTIFRGGLKQAKHAFCFADGKKTRVSEHCEEEEAQGCSLNI